MLHCNICTLLSQLNKSLVAPGCLGALHHYSSFYLESPHQCCMRCYLHPSHLCLPPQVLSAPTLSSLSSEAAGHLSLHHPRHHCCPLCRPLFLPCCPTSSSGSQGCFVPDCWRIRIPHYPVNCTFI